MSIRLGIKYFMILPVELYFDLWGCNWEKSLALEHILNPFETIPIWEWLAFSNCYTSAEFKGCTNSAINAKLVDAPSCSNSADCRYHNSDNTSGWWVVATSAPQLLSYVLH